MQTLNHPKNRLKKKTKLDLNYMLSIDKCIVDSKTDRKKVKWGKKDIPCKLASRMTIKISKKWPQDETYY